MMNPSEPHIDAVGLDNEDLTVTFTDGDKGKYSPKELLDLASANDTLECTRDESEAGRKTP
jgi:hypothetical protein